MTRKGAIVVRTWDKMVGGVLLGVVASQLVRARKANISYQAQMVEDTLSVMSAVLPGQKSNYDRLYRLAYQANVVPSELTWGKRNLGFDYLDDFTDTFFVEKNDTHESNSCKERIIFYLTGGGYWLRPSIFHFHMASKLANLISGKVVMPMFPKGPTHHIVEAHKMILSRYLYLIREKGVDPSQITIVGDSTGGALAVAFMQQLRDYQLPLPQSAILIAPILDGTLQNVLVEFDQVEYEPFLQPKLLALETETFAQPFEPIDPLISPWFGSFKGLPPVQVIIGTRDMTMSYAALLKERAEAESLPIDFNIYPHMAHIFPIYPIPEADLALVDMVKFIEKVAAEV